MASVVSGGSSFSSALEFLSPSYLEMNNDIKVAMCCIMFSPIFWNSVARSEYYTHWLTRMSGDSRKGCYLLAFCTFAFGLFRDHMFRAAILTTPGSPWAAQEPWLKIVSICIFIWGNILVLSSMYALGVTGTYMGDYFGLLKDKRITGFPFNICDNPMYNGSTLCFLGTALWYARPTGVLLAGFVYIVYKVALLFEEPFTARIYEAKNKKAN